MSQRSIVEINHNFISEIAELPADEAIFLLLSAVTCGSDQAWRQLRRYGIRRLAECSHSDDRNDADEMRRRIARLEGENAQLKQQIAAALRALGRD